MTPGPDGEQGEGAANRGASPGSLPADRTTGTPPEAPGSIEFDGARIVARIGKPHGIRGEVTLRLHTDDPGNRFAVGATLGTQAPPGSGIPHTLVVRSARHHNGRWLVAFDGIPDRTGAEGLRGAHVLARTPDAEDPLEADQPADAWYEEQLVGLSAVRPDGSRLGTVAGLDIGPGQDRLVLTLEDGHTAYVPFVSALVPTVDIAGGCVVVDPPAGLLEF
ncbi:MAG: ribosome maturation factor RimM [Dermatophilaceae bacterium]